MTSTAKTTKATPAKRSRKATPAPAAASNGATPTAAEPTTPAAPKATTIKLHGRTMEVRRPTPEQIGVWHRTTSQLDGVDPNTLGGQEAARLLGRLLGVVESVLTHQTDKDWLSDRLMEGTLTLVQAAATITLTVEAFRMDAPTTGPAAPAKARRR